MRVILIGGPSNVGKSTVAQTLATRLGWGFRSTDRLARHPGRPWPQNGNPVPAHVVEHYRTHSVDELSAAVQAHYRGMWPDVADLVDAHATGEAGPLVLEGSALWPEQVATLQTPGVAAIWLTAPGALLRRRMYAASRFDELPDDGKELVTKFLGRAQRYNTLMTAAIARLGLASLDVGAEPLPAVELAEQCLRLICREWPLITAGCR